MSELLFHELTPKEYDLVYKYMSVYGEGSCQHSFVTMYALFEKYQPHLPNGGIKAFQGGGRDMIYFGLFHGGIVGYIQQPVK